VAKGIKVHVGESAIGDGNPHHQKLLVQAAALVEDISTTYKPSDAIIILSMALGIIHDAQRTMDQAVTLPVLLRCVGEVVQLVHSKKAGDAR